MSGRPSGINYVKPSEPSFLTKFKQQAGYKEGPSVDTKREVPKFEEDEDDDRPEADEEKPTVVVLHEGDLTQAEADEFAKSKDEDEDPNPGDGKILFKKPVKRPPGEGATSDLNVSSGKKKKKEERRHQKGQEGKGEGKKIRNTALLSFGDEEDEDS